MRLMHMLGFLVGRRESILTLWGNRWCLPVGAVLVLAGSLARNYDGHDLVREWSVLLHGFGASLGNSLALFVLFQLAARFRPRRLALRVPSWRDYPSFLGVFWMTAPMAWVYGIPYEHMLEPVEAVRANLWTLAAVSVWRVALISRVLSVAYGVRFVPVLLLTLLFGDAVAVVALSIAPMPTIDLMGGLRHPPEVQLIASTVFAARVWSVILLPVVLLSAVIWCAWLNPKDAPPAAKFGRVPRGVLLLSATALVGWSVAAWYVQPEVRRKYDVERAVSEQRFDDAVRVLSASSRADFPPVWDLPPRRQHGGESIAATLAGMRRAIDARADVPAWVCSAYAQKSRTEVLAMFHGLEWRLYSVPAKQLVEAELPWILPEGAILSEPAAFVARHDTTLDDAQREWWAEFGREAAIVEAASRPK